MKRRLPAAAATRNDNSLERPVSIKTKPEKTPVSSVPPRYTPFSVFANCLSHAARTAATVLCRLRICRRSLYSIHTRKRCFLFVFSDCSSTFLRVPLDILIVHVLFPVTTVFSCQMFALCRLLFFHSFPLCFSFCSSQLPALFQLCSSLSSS